MAAAWKSATDAAMAPAAARRATPFSRVLWGSRPRPRPRLGADRASRACATSSGSASPPTPVAHAAAARPWRGMVARAAPSSRAICTGAPSTPTRSPCARSTNDPFSKPHVVACEALGKNAVTSTDETVAMTRAPAHATSAAPATAAAAICAGDRPRAVSARASPRARTGASAIPAPMAAHAGPSGSVRPARSPHETPPSSVAAVASQATASVRAVASRARKNTQASHRVGRTLGMVATVARLHGWRVTNRSASERHCNTREDTAPPHVMLDVMSCPDPKRSRNGSATEHRSRARLGSVPMAPQQKHSAAALHFGVEPPSAGQAPEEENVMQSTYGSSPRGPLL
jgi:hypothetical protein